VNRTIFYNLRKRLGKNIKINRGAKIIGILSGANPALAEVFQCFTNTFFPALGPWVPGRKPNPLFHLIKYIITGVRVAIFYRPHVVFIEGTSPSSVIAPILRFFLPRVRIFAFVAEDTFYKVLRNPLGLRSGLVRFGINRVDFILATGHMLAEQVKMVFPKKELIVMYPKINSERLNQLLSIQYDPDAPYILQIGGGNQNCKGIDITISLLPAIKEMCPNSHLVILGYEANDLKVNSENLIIPGRVSDVGLYLRRSCLMIHPGRGDAFPVATLESMAAGVPPIVSNHTGTRELLEQVEPMLVRNLSIDDFKSGLAWFLQLNPEEKKRLSGKCRERLLNFLERDLVLTNERGIQRIKEIIESVK
jgi:glycosyltransferase involved in cell wall biosynthesis